MGVSSSPSYLKAPVGEHRCHLHPFLLVYIVYDLTGSLLPWITMFSLSLNFKGALHLCFALSERASEIPFCYIMLWFFWESRYGGNVSTPPSLNLCLSSRNSVDKLKVIKKNFYKLCLILLQICKASIQILAKIMN